MSYGRAAQMSSGFGFLAIRIRLACSNYWTKRMQKLQDWFVETITTDILCD